MFTKPIPGGEATFRDPEDYRGRDRLIVEAAAFAAPMDKGQRPKGPKETDEEYAAYQAQWEKDFVPPTFAEGMALLKVKEAIILAKLVSWTLREEDGSPKPLPTVETIGDLGIELYNALEEASGVADLEMGVDFSTSGDPEVDEERPTDGPGDSTGPSKEEKPTDDSPPPTPTGPASTPKRSRANGPSTTGASSQP